MLSNDLENLACALEQVVNEFPAEKASFLELVCCNLHSLAQRVEVLEGVPLAEDIVAPIQ